MKKIFVSFLFSALLPISGWSADVLDISNETELDAAIAQAVPGNTLGLDASFIISTTKKEIPDNVTLDGNGFSITSQTLTGNGTLLNQSGEPNVTVRDLTLIAGSTVGQWNIQCTNGSIYFENCTIQGRMIAWNGATIELVDCTYDRILEFGAGGSAFGEPLGVYGSGATMAATNCLFIIGWGGSPVNPGHVDLGMFHNFGGTPSPAKLTVYQCTIVGATDTVPNEDDRHLSVFKSDDGSAGGALAQTTVSNSVIIAEASSIFRQNSAATVTSRYNVNAGMLRNPLVLYNTVNPPRFYAFNITDNAVLDKTGDITEWNPFVDAFNGDYRLVSTSDAATANSTGGPVGASLGVLGVDENAFNENFNFYDSVDDLAPARTEDVFYGWHIARATNDQFFYSNAAGYSGRSARLEVQDTFDETGGAAHNQFVTQSIYQTFVTVPGKVYTVSAWSFRNEDAGPYTWADNGQYGNTIIGVADGVETDPSNVDAQTTINGAEETWTQGSVQMQALSNHMTVHLIHRTNGSWNYSDWDLLSFSVAAAPVTAGVEDYDLYR